MNGNNSEWEKIQKMDTKALFEYYKDQDYLKQYGKNKSAFKLQGMPPIYYLNLDGQEDRKIYMESQFKYWDIENYTRISAYDGRDDDLSDIVKGRYPDNEFW